MEITSNKEFVVNQGVEWDVPLHLKLGEECDQPLEDEGQKDSHESPPCDQVPEVEDVDLVYEQQPLVPTQEGVGEHVVWIFEEHGQSRVQLAWGGTREHPCEPVTVDYLLASVVLHLLEVQSEVVHHVFSQSLYVLVVLDVHLRDGFRNHGPGHNSSRKYLLDLLQIKLVELESHNPGGHNLEGLVVLLILLQQSPVPPIT